MMEVYLKLFKIKILSLILGYIYYLFHTTLLSVYYNLKKPILQK